MTEIKGNWLSNKENFAAADVNKDGELNLEEYCTYI